MEGLTTITYYDGVPYAEGPNGGQVPVPPAVAQGGCPPHRANGITANFGVSYDLSAVSTGDAPRPVVDAGGTLLDSPEASGLQGSDGVFAGAVGVAAQVELREPVLV